MLMLVTSHHCSSQQCLNIVSPLNSYFVLFSSNIPPPVVPFVFNIMISSIFNP